MVIRLSEELDAILFTVESTSCGSGSLQFVGLLDLRESALVNVLPDVIISNQGEYSLWSDESVSPVALFATADAIMANGETHFAPHYSRVTAYTFDAKRRAYSKRLQYITKSRYVSLDHEERITVLEPEKNEILSRLKRLADR